MFTPKYADPEKRKIYAKSLQSQKAIRRANPPFNKNVSKTT